MGRPRIDASHESEAIKFLDTRLEEGLDSELEARLACAARRAEVSSCLRVIILTLLKMVCIDTLAETASGPKIHGLRVCFLMGSSRAVLLCGMMSRLFEQLPRSRIPYLIAMQIRSPRYLSPKRGE